jgi:3-hydroxy acid dehydrogenase/malonic semialdehyde reductase
MKSQTVFITGASSGIGKACAERFAQLGANLVITARREDRLQAVSRDLSAQHGITCTALRLDVRNQEEVQQVFKELASKNIHIDILINNAGLALAMDKLQEGESSNWDTMIDTNVKGLLYVTKAALQDMLKQNRGHIINIGSVAGRGCYAGGNVYCATKYAVKALSQSLRMDLLETKIRVSEVAPGAVETEFSEVRWNDKARAKQFYQGFEPLVADDIADAVIYCATRPQHVNVAEIVVYPQAQASIRDVYRQSS